MLFFAILVFLEVFELFWQKGHNFREYIANLFHHYQKGVIVFILLHPSFYFALYAQFSFNNFSLTASILTLLKAADLSFKLSLMDKIYHKKHLGAFLPLFKSNFPISPLMKASGLMLYPSLFYIAYVS